MSQSNHGEILREILEEFYHKCCRNSLKASKGIPVIFVRKSCRDSWEIPGEILGGVWRNFRETLQGIPGKSWRTSRYILGGFSRNCLETPKENPGVFMEKCLKNT